MSNLTIDQILAEKRQEDNPDIYGIEKEASSQTSQPSQFSTEEVEKMASLLTEADLPSNNMSSSDSFQERLASALILNDHINSFLKEAEKVEVEVETKGKDEDEEDEEDEEAEKSASLKAARFIVQADEAGYTPEEIREFIEKNASKGGRLLQGMKRLITSRPAQVTGTAAGLGGAAYGGKEYGEAKMEEKARKLVPKVYRAGVVTGHRKGTRKGFEAGAHAANKAWIQRLKRHSNKRAE